jgi:multidrug resistance efflux pump
MVTDVFVNEGDLVREGTVLVRLSGRELEAARVVENARYETASLQSRQDAQSGHSVLAADREAAAARRGRTESESKEAWLSSPAEGRVLSARTRSLYGRTVAPGDSLLFVGRMDSLRVAIPLSERDAEEVAMGRRVELRLRVDPGHAYRFRIDELELAPENSDFDRASASELAATDVTHRLYRAYGTIANPGGRLRPGLSGIARIEAPAQSLVDRLAHLYARMVRADFWL